MCWKMHTNPPATMCRSAIIIVSITPSLHLHTDSSFLHAVALRPSRMFLAGCVFSGERQYSRGTKEEVVNRRWKKRRTDGKTHNTETKALIDHPFGKRQ